MPNIEETLRTKTHKDQGVDINRRVFYTLTDDKAMQAHRTAKAIAWLMHHLHEKQLLSDEALDEILLDCVI